MAEERRGIGGYVWTGVIVAVFFVAGGAIWPKYTLSWNLPAREQAAVDAAMKPVATTVLAQDCAEAARMDPDTATMTTVAALTSSSQQVNEILKTSWVNFEGIELSSANKRALADACQKLIFPPAEANAAPASG